MHLDIEILKEKTIEMGKKYKVLREQKIFLVGLIFGIVLSIFPQMLIAPFSFSSGILSYAGIPWLELRLEQYIAANLGLFFIVTIILVIIMVRGIAGIRRYESATLKYSGEKDDIFDDLKKVLKELGEDLNFKVTTPKGEEIVCRNHGKNNEDIIRLTFKENGLIRFFFCTDEPISDLIVEKIIKHYGRRSKAYAAKKRKRK